MSACMYVYNMYVYMHTCNCMYACMDGWMDEWMDGNIDVYLSMYVCYYAYTIHIIMFIVIITLSCLK